ncbi:MAG: IS66 family transposase [Nannocystaceae bacterium]|nr:IS66 family transposase [Nannocystaceae bacterium]
MAVLPVLLAEGRTDEVLAAVAALVARNETLERKFAALMHKGFKSNEGVSTAQLSLLLEQLRDQQPDDDKAAETTALSDDELQAHAEAAADRARAKALADGENAKRKPLKQKLPPELPRYDNVIEVPAEERACPTCAEQRVVIGYDVSEVVDFKPAELVVRRDMREKRACRPCEANVVRAPPGNKIVSRGQLGASVVAQLLYAKYEQGLPLHRQRKDFKRMGLNLPVSTMADQVKWAAKLLHVLWAVACEQVLASHVMHIDGTGVRVLDRDHPQGKRLGSLWAVIGANADRPRVAAYYYASTKKARGQRDDELGPADILALRKGITVSDADTLFTAQRRRAELIDCGCNMHARRYFVKALDGGDKRAALVLGAFKALYQVEAEVRDATPDERLAERRKYSTKIYDDLVKWCRVYEPKTPPKSPLGRAIGYLLRHRVSLRRFEEDGTIPIDNMAAEHAFVSVALTRKNFQFFGADTGGDRAAIIYMMLHCCRLAEVDPHEYLTDVLGVLESGVEVKRPEMLMPAEWKRRRASR